MSIAIDINSPVVCDKSEKYIARLSSNEKLSREEYLECYEISEKVFEQYENGKRPDDFPPQVFSLLDLLSNNFPDAAPVAMGFNACNETPEISSLLFMSVLAINFLQRSTDPSGGTPTLPVGELFDHYHALMPIPDADNDIDHVTDTLTNEFAEELVGYQDIGKLFPDVPDAPPENSLTGGDNVPRVTSKPVPIPDSPPVPPLKIDNTKDGNASGVRLPAVPPRAGMPVPTRTEPQENSTPPGEDNLSQENLFTNPPGDNEFNEPEDEEDTPAPIGELGEYKPANRPGFIDDNDDNNNDNDNSNLESNPYENAPNAFSSDSGNSEKSQSRPVSDTTQPQPPPVKEGSEVTPDTDKEEDTSSENDKYIDFSTISNQSQALKEVGYDPNDSPEDIKERLYEDSGDETFGIFQDLTNDDDPDGEPSDEELQELGIVDVDDEDDLNTENLGNSENSEDTEKLLARMLAKVNQQLTKYLIGLGIAVVVIAIIFCALLEMSDKPPAATPQYLPVETTTTPGKPQAKEKEITPVSIANENEISSVCNNPYNALDKSFDNPFVCERLYNFDFVNVIFKFANQSVSKIAIVTGDQTSSSASHGIQSWCSHFAATDFIFHFNATTRKTFTIDVSVSKNPKLPKTFDVTSKENPNGITTDQIEVTIVGARLPGGCAIKNRKNINTGEPSGNFALEKITFLHKES